MGNLEVGKLFNNRLKRLRRRWLRERFWKAAYLGWAGGCPLTLLLQQGPQLSQLHRVRFSVTRRSPIALGHGRSFVGRHLAGISVPCSFSLRRGWGLSAPEGRDLPVMMDTANTNMTHWIPFCRATLSMAADQLTPPLTVEASPLFKIYCLL